MNEIQSTGETGVPYAKRVKILDASYVKEMRLVIWKIAIIDEDMVIRLAWRAGDLNQALDISIEIPDDLMAKFCNDIIGKELNLVMEGQCVELPDGKMKDLSHVEIRELEKHLDQFPIAESEAIIEAARIAQQGK